jgi:ketosteroid isomerase-like protein
MKLQRTLVAFLILASGGCLGTELETATYDPEVVEEEAMVWLDSFLAGIRGGAATYGEALALFDDHAEFSFVFEGTMFRSRAAVDEGFSEVFEQLQTETIGALETSVTALGPDLAYIASTGTFSRILMDGTETEEKGYGFTGVLVRTVDGWKARFFHNSEVELVE